MIRTYCLGLLVYVRPLFQYCSPVWNPHYHCDIAKIESVQRRLTKHIGTFKSFSYAHRLDILCAESLELRRLKFDLIMIYCIAHGLNALEFFDCFTFGSSITCDHTLKLMKQASLVNSRAFSCANRSTNV